MKNYKKERQKHIQSGLLILWKEDATEEERQEVIQKLYLDNKDKIFNMQTFEMKKGVDIYDKYKKFERDCK